MAVNTTTQVTLPAMGESVREGTVLEWHKQEGDAVAEGETIVEVSTDKVDAEVPAPASGHADADRRRRGRHDRGRRRARRDRQRRAARAVAGNGEPPARRGSGGSGPPPTAPAAQRRPSLLGERDGAEIVDIVTPGGGESVTEGTILEWAVAVGDEVADGQTIVELSTDKVDMELPAPGAGVDHRDPRRGRRHGDVGQVIARMLVGAGARRVAAARRRQRRARRRGRRTARAPPAATARAPPTGTRRRSRRSRAASPRPRASTSSAVHGSGPAGRITKADVLAAKAAPPPAAAPPARAPARRRAPPRAPHAPAPGATRCAAAPPCSPATWTSRARSRPRPPSAR